MSPRRGALATSASTSHVSCQYGSLSSTALASRLYGGPTMRLHILRLLARFPRCLRETETTGVSPDHLRDIELHRLNFSDDVVTVSESYPPASRVRFSRRKSTTSTRARSQRPLRSSSSIG